MDATWKGFLWDAHTPDSIGKGSFGHVIDQSSGMAYQQELFCNSLSLDNCGDKSAVFWILNLNAEAFLQGFWKRDFTRYTQRTVLDDGDIIGFFWGKLQFS